MNKKTATSHISFLQKPEQPMQLNIELTTLVFCEKDGTHEIDVCNANTDHISNALQRILC